MIAPLQQGEFFQPDVLASERHSMPICPFKIALAHLHSPSYTVAVNLHRRRDHSERGSVDGWGLMHLLAADAVRAFLEGANRGPGGPNPESLAAADAWTTVSVLAAEPARSNALGICSGTSYQFDESKAWSTILRITETEQQNLPKGLEFCTV